MADIVCLYHDDCFDGLGAAWAVSKRFPEAKCISVQHNDAPPADLLGKIVYIVDFCYPFDTLCQIAATTEELHVFDHHVDKETPIAKFNDFVHAMGWDKDKFRAVYDGSRSGAKLTWESLLPQYSTPSIIDFISDRDLWKFELDETELVMAGLGSYPMNLLEWDARFRWDPSFDNAIPNGWDRAMLHPHLCAMNRLMDDGRVVLRKAQMDITRIIASCERTIVLEGHTVPLINVPRMLTSETLTLLALGRPFAVGYFDTESFRQFSLRSSPDGMDVLPIAKTYGGGGHRNAAGFRVKRDHPLAQY